MKKQLVLVIMFVFFALTFFSACGNAGGGDSGRALLNYLPDDVSGYLFLDVNGLSKLNSFDDMEKDFNSSEKGKKYQEFVKLTGIDPRKDISGLAVGFYVDENNVKNTKPDFIFVTAVKYDKAKVMESVKKKGGELKEETYEAVKIYNANKEGNDISIVFIDNAHIIFASSSVVKKAVDLFKGKGKSVLQNDKQKAYVNMINEKALFAVVYNIPKAFRIKKNVGMGVLDFTKAECFLGSVWRTSSAFEADLRLLSKDKVANDGMKNLLNMFKGFGASQPDYKDLLNAVKINSDENMLNITITVTDAFIEKMKAKVKSKLGGTK